MRLKINECPEMKKIAFSCDEKYPLARDHLNKYNTTAFIGTQGSGKTSLMLNFLTGFYKKTFHFVYIFMPKISRNSLHNNIFDKYLPKDQVYEELNEQTINELYEKLKSNSMRGFKSLVIYDDVQRSLKDYNTLKSLKNIVCNQRHLKVVNLILLQNWFALDRSLREVVINVILFKLGKSQNEKIFNGIIESHRDRFDGIRKLVFEQHHDWMFVNIKSQRVYKGFNEILLDDEEEEEDEVEVKKNSVSKGDMILNNDTKFYVIIIYLNGK